jgi:hypothetical protein
MADFLLLNKMALIVIAFCVPLALRRIPRNGLYGFRYGRALEDDVQWFEVNQKGALCLIATLALAILAKSLAPIEPRYAVAVDSAALLAGILLTLAVTRRKPA